MDKVTHAIVEHLHDDLVAAIRPVPEVGRELLVHSARDCLAHRMQLLIPRVFVVEFHRAREAWGLPADPGSTTATRRYLESLGPDTVGAWLRRYPVLEVLLRQVAQLSATHVTEVAARWLADRADAAALGIADDGAAVTRIEHLGGDAHRHGRMVAAVHLADGTRVVYKPRGLSPEVLVRNCLGILAHELDPVLAQCAPLSLDRGSHGWQEEVRPACASDAQAVPTFYRRLGAATAVLSALGATDMHHENLVAAGSRPVLLDLETALHASTALRAHELSAAIIYRLKCSTANTLMLPQRLPSGPYSVLLGGLGVPYEQRSERTDHVLVHRDTDGVDLARHTYPFSHRDNVLRAHDGAPTDVLDYTADLLAGMREATAVIEARADRLVELLDGRPVELRQIVRSTAVYGRVLEAATHPDNLGHPDDVERVLGLLGPPPGIDRRAVQAFILDAERAALRRGDVPYFSVRADDVRLVSEGQTSGPFTDLSPRDRAVHGIRAARVRELPFEELLLEEGLAELRSVRRRHQPAYQPRSSGSWGVAFLGTDGIDAAAVLDRLVDVSVLVDGVDGAERGWVPGAFAPHLATFDPGSSVSLHDAGGIVLPFERSGADEVAAQARRGLRSLTRVYRERLAALPWSAASGALSVDYVLGHGGASLALPAAGPDLHADDTMRGAPGAAVLLAGFPGTDPTVLQRLRSVVAHDAAGSGRLDLAHGPLGLLWARHRLTTALGDDAAATGAARRIARLVASRDDAPVGWCHGHAGLLVVAAATDVDEADLRWHAERAVRLPELGEPVDLCVCHGAAGVVQTLVHCAGVRGSRWPLDLAADYWPRVAKHARDEGYVTGAAGRQGVLGYFLGWSGIADSGLLLEAAVAGAVPWVPLSMASSVPASQGAR
ncbi:MAG: DUF4135 domain-containing protein [Dermatophilaceae bacterium]